MSVPRLSVVLACYNEAEHLRESVRTLEATLARINCPTELIFIDDASRDATPAILGEIAAAHPEYRVAFHERNVGRGGTVAEGLRMARGEIAGYLDVDLEVGPWYILPAIAAFDDDKCDAVVARRVYKIHASPFSITRHLAHFIYRRLVHRALPMPVSDSEAGFKFFRRERILPVLERCEDTRWFWDTEVIVRAHQAGLRIREITCLYNRNLAKTSTVRLIPDTIEYLRLLRRLRRKLRGV